MPEIFCSICDTKCSTDLTIQCEKCDRFVCQEHYIGKCTNCDSYICDSCNYFISKPIVLLNIHILLCFKCAPIFYNECKKCKEEYWNSVLYNKVCKGCWYNCLKDYIHHDILKIILCDFL